MKKLNKVLSLTAAAALALSLTACSGGTQGTAESPAGNSNTPAAGDGAAYKVAGDQADGPRLPGRDCQRHHRPAG